MKLTIIFKEEIEEHMKKQFGHFTNPKQVYGVKSVHMEGGTYTPLFRTRFAGAWMTFPDFTVRRSDNV